MVTFTERVLILVLEFTWLSCSAGTDHCVVSVTQPQFMEAFTESSNITISCTFTAQSCPTSSLNILWFRYLAQTHEALCTPTCNNSGKFNLLSPAKDQTFLQINTPSVEDSAIYYCGIAFSDSSTTTSKKTGAGTLLVIRESKTYSPGINIMVAVSLLLFLYLTAILGISKFFSKPKSKRSEKEDLRGKHNVCAKGSKEAVCQAIAKELYKKKHKRKFWPGSLANRRARGEPS